MKSPKTPLKSSLKEFLEWVAVSGKEIPEVERARIPTDLAKNHEHYLYGHPKQDT